MKKILSLLLVLVLLCGLTACSGTDPMEQAEEPTTVTTGTVALPKGLNPLTGKNDMTGSSTRPVAVMITNEPGIIGNQYGIDKADFYMETEAEGSVSRMMVAFSNADRMPSKLGPIRSARTPFVAVADALGAVYIYSGATQYVLDVIKNTTNFDSFTNDGSALWRDDYLSAHANVSWNNLITSGEKVAAKIEKSKFPTQAVKDPPFSFGNKTGDITANTVQLKSTASTNVTFIYDAETGLYGKNLGKADSCKPHKSLEGNQIQVTNVLILYSEKYVENKDSKYTWYNFKRGEGTGYLISNGKAREIKFDRSKDNLILTEKDGSKATLAPGKTYMFLTDKTLSDSLVLK